jgi:hypothetical protein
MVFWQDTHRRMLSGYIFNPAYLVTRPGSAGADGHAPGKQPAFLESSFKVEKIDQHLSEKEEQQILLSLMMITLLERSRG